jgi:CheY-like chemotaxis protein
MSDDTPAVLVVEDEPLLRLFVAELLLDAGFRVIEAASAAEALTILHAGLNVVVVLADVDMPPGMSGYELAHEIHRSWPGVEILITSGRRWPEQGDLPAGAAFLAKPCPNDALLLHVRSAVERANAAFAAKQPDTMDETSGNVVAFPGTATGS